MEEDRPRKGEASADQERSVVQPEEEAAGGGEEGEECGGDGGDEGEEEGERCEQGSGAHISCEEAAAVPRCGCCACTESQRLWWQQRTPGKEKEEKLKIKVDEEGSARQTRRTRQARRTGPCRLQALGIR